MSGHTEHSLPVIGKWTSPIYLSHDHESLASKTSSLVATTFFAVLVATSFVLLHYQEKLLRHSILDGLDGQGKIAARAIEAVLDEGLTEANTVSRNLPVQALAAGRRGEVESYLRKMLATFPKFENGIFVLDRQGRLLADYPSHPKLYGQSFALREYFQRTMQEGKGIVSKPVKALRTGRPAFAFTAPIRDTKGQILAIVVCSMDLLSEQSLGDYRKLKFGETGYLFIFDKTRLLVSHPDSAQEMTYIEAGTNPLVEAALQGFEGAGETISSQGVPALLAVRHIPRTEWTVGVQLDQAEGYAPLAAMRVRIFGLSAAAILLATILGGVAIRRVSRPLQQLQRVAHRITSDLDDTENKGGYKPSPFADSFR
jgi:C4-dicarboxylate-specific signal transduction histidine kinase